MHQNSNNQIRTGITFALCAVLPAFSLTSCLLVGNKAGSPGDGTVGQQLVDLQKAKKAGLLSDEEYQKQKNKALGYPTDP